jgi:hypothetical protein
MAAENNTKPGTKLEFCSGIIGKNCTFAGWFPEELSLVIRLPPLPANPFSLFGSPSKWLIRAILQKKRVD